MTKGHRWIVPLLTFLVAGAWTASAARQGRLIGKVVDTEGHPIAGVKVTTTCAEDPDFDDVATTNDKGIFLVDFSRINVLYHYEFDKAGYVTLKVDQRWTIEGTERHEFKMLPAEAIAPAQAVVGEAQPPASTSTSNEAILAFNAGASSFRARDYATAAARFEEALQHDPQLRQAWAALSQAQVEQKRYSEAAAAADKAMALGATDEPVLRARWEAYRHLGDKAKEASAREDLEKVSRLTEEAKRIHNEGVALVKSGDDAGAYAKFKEALTIDPNLQPALLGLAAAGLKTGHAAEASAAAETVLKADPQNEAAIRDRYNAALQLGDEAKVVDALVSLAAVEPATARDNLFKLATAAYDADDVPAAKARLAKVLELDPNHARAHYLLGLLLMREGAKQEARSHLERFLALAPTDPDAGTAREALKYMK
jgi:Tfp pilus assembly protein PilF